MTVNRFSIHSYAILAAGICLCFAAIGLAIDCYEEIDPVYRDAKTHDPIHIKDVNDIEWVRNDIINYLWKETGWPGQKLPAAAKVSDANIPGWIKDIDSVNLAQVDRLDIEMDYRLHSYAYHLHPKKSVNRLLIFQMGHSNEIIAYGGKETINHFLDQGFSIMTLWMPLFGENSRTAYDVPDYNTITFTEGLLGHNQMSHKLENSRGSFIRFFIEPVVVAVNYAEKKYNYRNINMAGISGGGWTTHLCAAVDPRIKISIPVAGSLPLYLRTGPCPNGSTGDDEQTWPALYKDTASWPDIYILGSYGKGRAQTHVLNKYDNCCFFGINYQTYESEVSNAVKKLGAGSYRVYLDDSHKTHTISNIVIEQVIDPALNNPLPPSPAPNATDKKTVYNVKDYGAVGDGKNRDTAAIQKAIDDCFAQGGGKVSLAGGTFLSGTIYLKSNVALFIEAGAAILGSTDITDYPETHPSYRSSSDDYTCRSLIYAEKAETIAILGQGTVNGQGEKFTAAKTQLERPYILRFVECKNITVKDITLMNSAMWGMHYLACSDVCIDGLSIYNRVPVHCCHDGIDIDSSENVRIANCYIDAEDDGICLKSTSDRAAKNITITNCILSSFCAAIKLGTESIGGFENIAISNCAIYNTRLSGIGLQLNDGGKFDRISISNIVMDNCGDAIFIRYGQRGRPVAGVTKDPKLGTMRNIIISNVQATRIGSLGGLISGLPGYPIENVTLDNVRISFNGGGTPADANKVIPVAPEAFPHNEMFGTLPAYGFLCRFVKNLKLNNLQLEFTQDDFRPALIMDQVQDLYLSGFDADSIRQTPAVIQLKNVDGAMIQNCRPRKTDTTWIQLEGKNTNDIAIMNNDFGRINRIVEKSKEVNKKTLYLKNNK